MESLAFVTVPLLITGYVAYRYVKKKRARKRLLGELALDASLVRASVVYFNLDPSQAARMTLPPNVVQSLVKTQGQLPSLDSATVDRAMRAWMSHFSPPLRVPAEAADREAEALSAALLKLILEDS